jgi:TRAP-type uncharacterized transport system substrate-binding protein
MGYGDSDIGGLKTPLVVGRGKFDFGFGNPAGLAGMAFLGRGLYKTRVPILALGVFPSWDRLVFAVHKDTGVSSIEEIKTRKIPLRVSTRSGDKFHTTLYVIDQVLRGYGFSLAEMEKWGGTMLRCNRPGGQERKEHIRSGSADAVFDEGLKSWGAVALESGMRFLPIRDDVLKKLERTGFPRANVTNKHYPSLEETIVTLDFSGWTFFCRRDLTNEIAYRMAEAVDLSHEYTPVDHFDRRPMTMQEFCQGGEGGALIIPLHPGAKKYYREKGCL